MTVPYSHPEITKNQTHDWTEATRHSPCPACGKPDWCAVADGGSLVRCMRPEIASTPTGYRHVRDHPDGGRLFGRECDKPIARHTTSRTSAPDFERMYAAARAAVEPGSIADWSDAELGLTGEVVDALSPGWSERYRCVVFPERDATGRVIGLERHYARRIKKAIKGGRRGLFFAPPLAPTGVVLIVEGASDTAAAIQMGFVAVGRYSNMGGGPMLAELLAGRDVVVFGEHDSKPDGSWPGREGAEHIAGQLVGACRSVRIAYPPPGIKDVRALLMGGAR